MVGRLTSQKHWSVEYVLQQPLARLFMLWTENEISQGAEWDETPSYAEQDSMDDLVAAVKSLRKPSA